MKIESKKKNPTTCLSSGCLKSSASRLGKAAAAEALQTETLNPRFFFADPTPIENELNNGLLNPEQNGEALSHKLTEEYETEAIKTQRENELFLTSEKSALCSALLQANQIKSNRMFCFS